MMFKIMVRMPKEKQFKRFTFNGRDTFTESEGLSFKANKQVQFPGAKIVLVELKQMPPSNEFAPERFGLRSLR